MMMTVYVLTLQIKRKKYTHNTVMRHLFVNCQLHKTPHREEVEVTHRIPPTIQGQSSSISSDPKAKDKMR